MSILFHCPWHNNQEWFNLIKKKFKKNKVYTIKDNPDFSKIEYAIIWQLSSDIMIKLKNVKIFFSMGAGVDHILDLKGYKGQTIIRLKDSFMAERMTNHILSQILFYQLNLRLYFEAQLRRQWIDDIEPKLNQDITIGIFGLGYLGSFVGKELYKKGYNIIGFKKNKRIKKYIFPVFSNKKDLKIFLNKSDIIVSILPKTKETYHIINSKFLKKMKKKSLLINTGRGSTINEKDLISHLKLNKDFHASLDVLENEPLNSSSPLWKFNNVIITPHVASLTVIKTAVDFIHKRYQEYILKGKIKSDVDIKKGY